jgi:hypothetical protein
LLSPVGGPAGDAPAAGSSLPAALPPSSGGGGLEGAGETGGAATAIGLALSCRLPASRLIASGASGAGTGGAETTVRGRVSMTASAGTRSVGCFGAAGGAMKNAAARPCTRSGASGVGGVGPCPTAAINALQGSASINPSTTAGEAAVNG